MYSNLLAIKSYVGNDGKLHFVDGTGADSVLNFNRGYNLVYVGSYDSYTIKTYNCTNVPGYRNLTANDFIFRMTGLKYNIVNNIYLQSPQEWSLNGKITYDASTGTLKVTYVGIGAQYTDIVIRGDIYAYIKL